MLIYGGVCRDNLEPATACAVSNGLGLGSDTLVYDVSNACLGIMNGMVQVANAIELGHIEAGMVVSCESARQIIDITIDRLLDGLDDTAEIQSINQSAQDVTEQLVDLDVRIRKEGWDLEIAFRSRAAKMERSHG